MSATSTTRACPKCNSQVASDTKFCPNCGTAVSGIFSGGGTPLVGTTAMGVDDLDTLFPILQEATLGDYDLYGELGRGGMAAVYLALDLALNRKVAIKTMLPELVSRTGMVDRFKREAQTAAALSHPHIIQIFSVKETKRLVYFVMKYIEGRSLESVIIERGRLDVDLTRVILSQVGGALAFAHRKGVVHRDMKPANIMLEEDGWAIVTDFGIAKVQEAQNLTATGTAIGTPHYMSPEQFHNKAVVTGASDQYSLGIVAHEMLTGRKPFDGGTYAEIITQHLFEPVPDLRSVRPDIPQHVAETVARMLSKEASARFPDLDAAVAALGMPTTTQGDAARTQIVSLARSGPERKVRLSVPQSPIPLSRRTPAATVVESASARPATVAANAPKKPAPAAPKTATNSHSSLAIAAAVLVMLGVGGTIAYLKFSGGSDITNPVRSGETQGAPALTTGAPPPAAPADSLLASAKTDSAPVVTTPPPVTPTKPTDTKKIDSKAEAARIAAAKALAAKTTGTGTKGAAAVTPDAGTKTAPTQTADAATTKTAAPPVQAPAPAPVNTAPQPVEVRIGSRVPTATLYVNGATYGLVSSLGIIKLTPNAKGELNLVIRAEGCAGKWDTTIVVPAGSTDRVSIGYRGPTC